MIYYPEPRGVVWSCHHHSTPRHSYVTVTALLYYDPIELMFTDRSVTAAYTLLPSRYYVYSKISLESVIIKVVSKPKHRT